MILHIIYINYNFILLHILIILTYINNNFVYLLQTPCPDVIKPAIIPKKRKFSNVSFDSINSLDDAASFQRSDTLSSVPLRSHTSESEISLEQNNDGECCVVQF